MTSFRSRLVSLVALSLLLPGAAACGAPNGGPNGGATGDSLALDEMSEGVVHAVRFGVDAIRVDPTDENAHATIGAALEAAAAGAVIEVAPGTYRERLVIDRAVTLIGAGHETTKVVAGAGDGALEPVLAIRLGTQPGPVVVQGLRFTLEGEGEEGSVRRGAAIQIDTSNATLSDVAVIGSPASGIAVTNGAVDMERLLVVGCWATGVAIVQEDGSGGPIRLLDSDVRNCRHRGVTIAGAAENVVVERCLVQGSDWHGIRYDGAAPQIRHNVIRDNVRSGIYASGSTRALVEGNLFVNNGMSCWYTNGDRIVANTFMATEAENAFIGSRAHVSVLGASDPLIEDNLFVGGPVGIYLGQIGGSGENTQSRGQARASDNVAVRVERLVDGGELVIGAGHGPNRVAEPDEIEWDGTGPRHAEAGAQREMRIASRWSELFEEERAIVALRTSQQEGRAAQATSASLRSSAYERAQPWIESALQIQDADERARAFESMLAAVASSDPVQCFAGLLAVQATGEAAFDRAPFAAHARRIASESTGPVRVSAFYVLNISGRTDDDLGLLRGALSESPDRDLRDAGLHLLTMYAGRELVGETEEVALALLGSYAERDRIQLNGLWGAKVGERLEAWLLERWRSDDRQASNDALYFGLSTLHDKSAAVVEALIEAATDPDHNNSSRAVWGLTYGVSPASHPRVATFFLDLFEARGQEHTRADALRAVHQYGDASHLERLRAIAANELVSDDLREAARRAIAAIESRGE